MRPGPYAVLLALAVSGCGSGESAGSGSPDLSVFNGWARSAGGELGEEGTKVTAFPDGSLVVAGYFNDTAVFGAGTPNETVFTSFGGQDVCLVRYASDGAFVWARQAGGAENDVALDVDGLPDGSFLVTGAYRASSTFGPGEPNETGLDTATLSAPFVARYDTDGHLTWIRPVVVGPGRTHPGASQGTSVGTLPDGSSWVTGWYIGSVTFGLGEVNETTFFSDNAVTLFLARYEADGSLAWATTALDHIQPRGLDVFPDGSSVVTGWTSGDVAFGAGEPNETTLPVLGMPSGFVARYGPDGAFAWARRAGTSSGRLEGADAAAVADGSAVVIGKFDGDALFGAGTPNSTLLSSAGHKDVFLAAYASNGSLLWARRAGGNLDDYGESVAVHADGTVYAVGLCQNAVFGPGESGEKSVLTAGGGDIFAARYHASTGLLKGVRLSGGENTDYAMGVAVFDDRSFVVTGRFHDLCHFGIGPFQETLIPSGPGPTYFGELFVARFGPTGEF